MWPGNKGGRCHHYELGTKYLSPDLSAESGGLEWCNKELLLLQLHIGSCVSGKIKKIPPYESV